MSKAIGSSRRARRGRRLLVQDDHGLSGGTPIFSSPMRGGARRRPVVLSQARMPGWTCRWGRGPVGHAQEDQETFDPGRRLHPLSPAIAGVGTRPDRALACRPERSSPLRSGHARCATPRGSESCLATRTPPTPHTPENRGLVRPSLEPAVFLQITSVGLLWGGRLRRPRTVTVWRRAPVPVLMSLTGSARPLGRAPR
jgi:hypothetical protein